MLKAMLVEKYRKNIKKLILLISFYLKLGKKWEVPFFPPPRNGNT